MEWWLIECPWAGALVAADTQERAGELANTIDWEATGVEIRSIHTLDAPGPPTVEGVYVHWVG